MGCVYHPHRDATKFCYQCEADLCESCAVSQDGNRALCNRCMLALSVEDVKVEELNRKLAEEARLLGLGENWRPTYMQTVLTIGILLAFLLTGLHFYWSDPVPHRKGVLNPADPMRMFASLQTALEHYALTNGGSFPDRLYDLLPEFIDDTAPHRRILRQLQYELDFRKGYVLRIKDNAPLPGKDLVVTARGARPSGVMFPGDGS